MSEEEIVLETKNKKRIEQREADGLWYVRLRQDDREATLIDGEHMRGPFEFEFKAVDWFDTFKMKSRDEDRQRKD